jgi:putative ABC transport system substrate-binding protein
MRRRNFIAFIGGAALWPLAIRAAQQPKIPIIGFVHSGSPSYFAPFGDGFRAGLREAGYVEKQNVAIEFRWAEGQYERLSALVADLIERNVDVIFAAGGSDPAKVAKAATKTIPIVFVSAADPVRTGLVESLNRPGGNVTGVSLLASVLNSKKLDLMHELVPQASTIGALINPSYPEAKLQSDDFRAAADQLGLRLALLPASTDTEINAVFETLKRRHVDALIVGNDPFFGARRDQLIGLAARYLMPTMHFQNEFVVSGGLVSYGPRFADGYRQGGNYVGRVLNGEKPAELPILQPTKFELVINAKTAKALGLTIRPGLLAVADEVIE